MKARSRLVRLKKSRTDLSILTGFFLILTELALLPPFMRLLLTATGLIAIAVLVLPSLLLLLLISTAAAADADAFDLTKEVVTMMYHLQRMGLLQSTSTSSIPLLRQMAGMVVSRKVLCVTRIEEGQYSSVPCPSLSRPRTPGVRIHCCSIPHIYSEERDPDATSG